MVHDSPKAGRISRVAADLPRPCEEHADLARAIAAYRQGAAK
jgi:hypothetical protein